MNNSKVSPHEHGVVQRTEHIVTYRNPEDPNEIGVKLTLNNDTSLFIYGLFLGIHNFLVSLTYHESLYKDKRELYKEAYNLLMEYFEHKMFSINPTMALLLPTKEQLLAISPAAMDAKFNIV